MLQLFHKTQRQTDPITIDCFITENRHKLQLIGFIGNDYILVDWRMIPSQMDPKSFTFPE